MAELSINGATYSYNANPAHRNMTPDRSQWTVPLPREENTFRFSIESNWRHESYSWGLYIENGNAHYLGLDRDHQTQVFLARFEARTVPEVWHGYPVGHRDRSPPETILKKWIDGNVLPKAKIAKIAAGKKCTL